MLDIVNTAKTGPGSKLLDRVLYFLVKISIRMLNFLKSFYAFLEDPIIYILCNFQLVIRMFSTILMPTKIGPEFGSGSQALVPASIPSLLRTLLGGSEFVARCDFVWLLEKGLFFLFAKGNDQVLCAFLSQKCPFIGSCSSIARNCPKVIIFRVVMLQGKPHPLRKLIDHNCRIKENSRRLIEEQIDKSDAETIFVFTDGSCRQNPGPCGAGACVFLPGQEECIELKKPVSKLASILLGELVAIEMALTFIQSEGRKRKVSSVQIFCDSQSAVGLLTLGWKPSSFQETSNQIKKQIEELKQKGVRIAIDWTPGHADIAHICW